MDQKENQTGHPESGTDQTQNPGSTEAPTAAPTQGESAASAEDPTSVVETSSGPQASQDEPTADEAPVQAATEPTEQHADREQHVSEGGLNLGDVVAGVAAMGLAAVFGAAGDGDTRDDNKGASQKAEDTSGTDSSGEVGAEANAAGTDSEPETSAASQEAVQESVSETEQDSSQSQMSAEETDRAGDTQTDATQDSMDQSTSQAETQTSTSSAAIQEDDGSSMTMEEVMAASDEQLARKPIHRGMLTTGTVIMLSQEGLVVDVGQKVEGLVPYNQLFEFEADAAEAAKYFKPGDELQVYAIRVDIANSTIILSKKRADQERAWNLLQDIFDKKLPVEVEIVEKVRGGLVANLGVRAFLPASQVDVRRINDLSPYVEQRMRVRIIELNRRRNRVIISRRSIMEEELAGVKEETLKKLEPGAKLEGEVVEITDFGAFVNLGGVDGLVHRSEITHGRFNHPREVLEVGQKVQVEVMDMDLERERINLSMKSLKGDPWENVLANFQIGQKVSGKVTNITPFGAFVEIESGLEGLIHVSEMSWTKRVRHPKEVVEEGQEVEAMILKIDVPQQRISLGLRQTQPDPWSSLPDRFPPGTEVTGPITGLTDFGVFMEIEEGIEGLVHISELAHEHIEDISQHFNKGDEVTAVVLNIDPIEQRASLSRKRTLPYSAGEGSYEGGAPLGAPQSRGGARKGGRRGGRRSQGIDYDYSYASADAGSKTTTKLGDVYADLFAQFGLSDNQPQAEVQSGDAGSSAEDSSSTEASASASTDSGTDDATQASEPQSAAPQTTEEAPAEQKQEAPKQAEPQPDEEPENAIDAAEAAALLTAAFRQGRRPAPSTPEPQDEPSETAQSEEEKEPSA